MDPFAETTDLLSDQLETFVVEKATEFLDSDTITSMVELRPNVKNIVIRAVNTTGHLVGDFLRTLAVDVASCSSAHDIFIEIKDAMCCEIVTPLWWYVSAWYLIAWSMLCCGLPAGCFGRKRIPRSPWGPALELEQAGGGPIVLSDPKKINADIGAAIPAGGVLKNVTVKRGGAYDGTDVDGANFALRPTGKGPLTATSPGGFSSQVAVNISGSNPMHDRLPAPANRNRISVAPVKVRSGTGV